MPQVRVLSTEYCSGIDSQHYYSVLPGCGITTTEEYEVWGTLNEYPFVRDRCTDSSQKIIHAKASGGESGRCALRHAPDLTLLVRRTEGHQEWKGKEAEKKKAPLLRRRCREGFRGQESPGSDREFQPTRLELFMDSSDSAQG